MPKDHFDYILDVINHPQRMLTIILLGNNLTIVTGSLLGQRLFEQSLGEGSAVLAFCIITMTFFMLAELLPKKVFQVYPEETVNLFFIPLLWSFKVLGPMERLFRLLMIIFVGKSKVLKSVSSVSKEEFIRLLHEKTQEGIFNESEEAMMMKGMACESILAESAGIPIEEIPMVAENQVLEHIRKIDKVPESESVILTDANGKRKGLLVLKKSVMTLENISVDKDLLSFDNLPKTEWGDSILMALEKMNQYHIDVILITDATGSISGLLTKRRVMSYLLKDDLSEKSMVSPQESD